MAEPILLSWSGGKDSALALAALREDPAVGVVALLTTLTRGLHRVAVHGVRAELLRAQAASIGLPLVEVEIPPHCRDEEYDAALRTALDGIRGRHPALRRVAFGDLLLEDIRAYREERLAAAGMEAVFPIWGTDTSALARSFVDRGFRARLVCVDTSQLDGGFAGEPLDHHLIRRLPESVDPCGENGEFHTFVWDGPIFRRPVKHRVGERTLDGERFVRCDLLPGTEAEP